MKNNDEGLDELLALLKTHPELIKELVFDSSKITKLLRSAAAQQLALGVHTQQFLDYVAGPEDGYPITQCLHSTQHLCAKGTKVGLPSCLRGTQQWV
jgi:hypothetical protein